MEVQGVSPERVEEVENASIVSGQVDASGNLVLTTKGGQQKNAGSVVKPLFVWPVGSIYIGVTSTNPSEFFGGTWEQFANGQVLVGQDPAQAEFNTALEVGGAKTHTLTANEMPTHNHGGATGNDSPDHSHTGYTTSGGEHEHVYNHYSGNLPNGQGGGANDLARNNLGTFSTGGGGGHSHNIQTYGASVRHQHAIGNSGGGAAHNNLQPYIVVYMWRRTA